MCSRHRPEAGADSGDLYDQLADYLVASAFLDALEGPLLPACRSCSERALPNELFCAYHIRTFDTLEQECPLCHGAAVVMGGDEYQRCPRCKGTGEA